MLKRNQSDKLKKETSSLNLTDPEQIQKLEKNSTQLVQHHYEWRQHFDRQGYFDTFRNQSLFWLKRDPSLQAK
jgi:hypothetical protein